MTTFPLSKQNGPEIADHFVLGMAEMGYRGLSEQWLKRRAGDMHWRLIANAMGQKNALFTCSNGEPLYAAFCITSLQLSRPELPRLGAHLTLTADLYRVGHGRLASFVRIASDGDVIGGMVLVSTFVGRSEPGINRSVVRRSPRALAIPPDATPRVRRIAECAATIARDIRHQSLDFAGTWEEQKILPCPATDFNAVGLLYFPSYSALADRVLFQAGKTDSRMISARHVIYFGNVEPGEWIRVAFRHVPKGYDVVLRGEDDRLLALMRVSFRV